MFHNLHPSDTGGGGLPVIQGKYNYPTDKPEKPTRCAQCGFINDLMKVQTGAAFDGVGIKYGSQVTTVFSYPVPPGSKPITMTINTIEPTVVGGCPKCGSMNQVGELIGSSFGSGIDLSNL